MKVKSLRRVHLLEDTIVEILGGEEKPKKMKKFKSQAYYERLVKIYNILDDEMKGS